MRVAPLIQSALFDVATWDIDAEFGVFPQGARAKDAVFAPKPPPEPILIESKRYLFKRSKKSYPDQFWGEIVAYRLGCLLGVPVPPAFASWNSNTEHCAALIEWFYADRNEAFVMAGDFLQRVQPDFDRKRGAHHNLQDISRLMRSFTFHKILEPGWRQWWTDALLFDALIGNTDRHQDNWGLIFSRDQKAVHGRLSPLFDNGTSLGHERLVDRVNAWSEQDYERYIGKGRHHVKWSLVSHTLQNGHLELLSCALREWPETCETALARLNFTANDLSDSFSDLLGIAAPIPFSRERMTFMLNLLTRRHTLLKSMLT
jgi:hypothetical protein